MHFFLPLEFGIPQKILYLSNGAQNERGFSTIVLYTLTIYEHFKLQNLILKVYKLQNKVFTLFINFLN